MKLTLYCAKECRLEKMSSLKYFAEWATPKKWAEKWADVNLQPTHLSARNTHRVPSIEVSGRFAALVAHRRTHTDVAAQEFMDQVGPNEPSRSNSVQSGNSFNEWLPLLRTRR